MKRFLPTLAALLAISAAAWAIEATNTPIVGPTENGENKAGQQQVTDMARLKLGFGTLAITVSGSAGSGTLNNASGIITLSAATTGISGATPTVITLTDNKIQAGDFVDCTIDQTGATAGTVLACSAHATANQIVFSIYSATPTALTSSTILLEFATFTQGNPN